MIRVPSSRMDAIGVGPGKQPWWAVSAGLPGNQMSKSAGSGPLLCGLSFEGRIPSAVVRIRRVFPPAIGADRGAAGRFFTWHFGVERTGGGREVAHEPD